MSKLKNIIVLAFFSISAIFESYGQEIFRFEYISTQDGLSQSTVSAMLCDKEGFLWIGTNNGLNRFDGYNFKVFKGNTDPEGIFINNRVTEIWQDCRDFIWFKTHDGYFHYFHPSREKIQTLPNYLEKVAEDNLIITDFEQYNKNEIWLGLRHLGVYQLKYDEKKEDYNITHFLNRGQYALSNNNVYFVKKDSTGNLWVGTAKGVNFISIRDLEKGTPNFQHFFVDFGFTAFCETKDKIWLGTKENGIIIKDKKNNIYTQFNMDNHPVLTSNYNTKLYLSKQNKIYAAFDRKGLFEFDQYTNTWKKISTTGNSIDKIYEDRYQQLWITSETFGIDRYNPDTWESTHYKLSPPERENTTDLERHVFFEDNNNNFWIGLHEGGVALYNRNEDKFRFYLNDPSNSNTISSNIVASIIHDHSGQLWLGLGQYLGGIERVILRNPGFTHVLPKTDIEEVANNVTRSLHEDRMGNIWIGTKAGRLHILDSLYNEVAVYDEFETDNGIVSGANIYTITCDNDNYVWLGTKGKGVLVSQNPVNKNTVLRNIKFLNYQHSENDSTSITHNNIYCIVQNKQDEIWIGTYGNGLSLVKKQENGKRYFENINSKNSNLGNNMVRNIVFDSQNRMWVATGFGLYMRNANEKGNFMSFFYTPDNNNNNCLSYNDVIHIFEDSDHDLWFGTLGGGLNKLENLKDSAAIFKQYNRGNGLSNDVVLAVQEGDKGYIWVSTENGLNRINKKSGTVEIFNTNNGLSFNMFMENTCIKCRNGTLLFGGYKGFEVLNCDKLKVKNYRPKLELTNFQLFNKEVHVQDVNSPLKKTITYTDNLTLKHHQSSFSIKFSALDYQDPGIVQYAYCLENFDNDWNYVGNQNKATYTNLPSGDYTFKVKSTNRLGGWIKSPRELKITIFPPWYKNHWAYVAYAIVLIAFLISIRKIVMKINHYRNELTVEKRINELKLKFFTNISHEIRTPLTLILGPLEDIKRKTREISPEIYQELLIVHKNGKRMLHLINQLLDFRKIQNNKMSLKVDSLDIVKFCREVFNSFGPIAHYKNIKLVFETDKKSSEVWADPSQMDVVLYNLMSNAVKFTPSGGKVTFSIAHNSKDWVIISIRDEGKGIPEKNLQDLFTRYTILSDRETSGTGIGLSLAYEITRLHGGELSVSSRKGHGSTFIIVLQPGKKHLEKRSDVEFVLREAHAHHPVTSDIIEPQIKEPTKAADLPSNQKLSALIIEDNPEILDYICHSLHTNFNTYKASDSHEGLNKIEECNPDIIITDVMMPGIDGFELTKQLKKSFATSHIPIIMLTAKTDIEDRITGLECGADAYIQKPFNTRLLISTVNNLIQQRKRIISKFRDNKTIDPDTLKITGKDEKFLKDLIQYVQQNYSQEFSIEHLAEEMCVSRTVFYNKVKGLTGMSPVEFVRQIRLKIAVQLLEKGYNVSEVSFQVGFNDVKYFSRQFKNLFGYPPSKHNFERSRG
jgi:signal transduction histidine kinase/ligand-binding sensor domain-containing protein/DNA-binding response OmpR family regulator